MGIFSQWLKRNDSSRRTPLRKRRREGYQPRLEALEDRTLLTGLVFLSQPVTTEAGATINAVTVRDTDQSGNPVVGAAVGISIAPGSLSTGTTPLTTNAAGQAVFNDLSEDTPGTYVLTASSAGVSNATSNSFVIVGPTTTTTQPTTATTSYSSTSAETVTLVGNVTSNNGAVNGGTFSFTVGNFPSVTSGTVTDGTASASFTLPAGEASPVLTITTAYSGSGSFPASTNYGGSLDVANTPSPNALVVTSNADPAALSAGTLRYAIAQANADALDGISDTITFNTAVMTSSTIMLTQGDLALTAGTGTTTIDGGGQITVTSNNAIVYSGGIFLVNYGAQAILSGLTITGGNAGGYVGGGIYNGGSLLVSNCTVSDNNAYYGGGIEDDGSMTVINSNFFGNTAWYGGGICTFDTLNVSNSTLSDNFAYFGGGICNDSGTATVSDSTLAGNTGAYVGGGIYNQSGNYGNQGTLTVTNSTLSGNFGGQGGGIFNDFGGGMVTVSDSTLSGNSAAAGGGGGIFNCPTSTVNVTNSTLSGNSASDPGSSIYAEGGGIQNQGAMTVVSSTLSLNSADGDGGGIFDYTGATLTLQDTIVAANTGAPNPDISGSFTDSGNNLLGAALNPVIAPSSSANGAGDVFNDNPGLATLGSDGGPTQTMALSPGSPAIGAGVTADYPGTTTPITTDQRGLALDSPYPDIGAFQATPFISSLAASSAPAMAGAADFQITVTGIGFSNSSIVSTVYWNGLQLATTFDSSSQLLATVPGGDIGSAGVAYVTVINSGGNSSNPLPFFITDTSTSVASSGTATSTSAAGTVTASAGGTAGTPGSVSATAANGTGTVTVAQYTSDPEPVSPPAAGAYFDVNVPTGSNFTSVTVVDYDLNGGTTAYWWDGSSWLAASDQTFTSTASGGYIAITMTNSTSPSLSQLTGTYFAAVKPQVGLTLTGDVFVLNQTAKGALTISGNAVLTVAGTLQVDSSSASAVNLSGNAEVNAAQTLIVGGDAVSGNAKFTHAPKTHQADVANPLASLVNPTGGTSEAAVNLSGNSTKTLSPGDYPSISVSGNAVLILDSGTYIIGSGGITISGNATVKNASAAAGVFLYNEGALSVSGNASVDLTAFSTGAYAGLAIFQALSDASAITISGNANLNLNGGLLYDANVTSVVTFSGNALVEASLVVNELTISGNSDETALS